MAGLTTSPSRPGLAPSVALSVALHAGLIGLAAWLARGSDIDLPPVYRINLVAAPAGPRSVGRVQPETAPTPPAPAPVPASVESSPRNPLRRETPRRPTPPAATQVPNATRAAPQAAVPKAGGGEKGGTGTDVANLDLDGIEFPFPAYLRNIVNQIGANFESADPRPWSVDVAFMIHRDGSVTDLTVRRRSGNRIFDLAAQGAVEAAGRSRAFGPLPSGFGDDVLPVIFTITSNMFR